MISNSKKFHFLNIKEFFFKKYVKEIFFTLFESFLITIPIKVFARAIIVEIVKLKYYEKIKKKTLKVRRLTIMLHPGLTSFVFL